MRMKNFEHAFTQELSEHPLVKYKDMHRSGYCIRTWPYSSFPYSLTEVTEIQSGLKSKFLVKVLCQNTTVQIRSSTNICLCPHLAYISLCRR